uniref:Major sperm protein n=1 Tax=Ditylenchus dipsaci TaxID=166011 RepID=A0A915EGT0_9BILA
MDIPTGSKRSVSFCEENNEIHTSEDFSSPEVSSSGSDPLSHEIVTAPSSSQHNPIKTHIHHQLDERGEEILFRDENCGRERAFSAFSKCPFLVIVPEDDLLLLSCQSKSNSNILSGLLTLQNTSTTKSVIFKLKITSPEKFRVKPSSGSIGPLAVEQVKIVLQKEYRENFKSERFLLLAVLTSKQDVKEFRAVWTIAEDKEKFQAKFNCRIAGHDGNGSSKKHSIETSKKNSYSVSKSLNPPAVEESSGIKTDLAILLAEREMTVFRQMNSIRNQLDTIKIVIVFLFLFQAFSFLFLLNQVGWFDSSQKTGKSRIDF